MACDGKESGGINPMMTRDLCRYLAATLSRLLCCPLLGQFRLDLRDRRDGLYVTPERRARCWRKSLPADLVLSEISIFLTILSVYAWIVCSFVRLREKGDMLIPS